jgi:hypothetical protein
VISLRLKEAKALSMVRDGFKSLYRSGAWFTEGFLPKLLEKTGLPRGKASKAGVVAGSAAGFASIVVGMGFFLAIPVSIPMFSVAVAVYAAKGIAMVAGAATLLAGTSAVVTTSGIGMCRALTHDVSGAMKNRHTSKLKAAAPPAPEQTKVLMRQRLVDGFRKALHRTPAPAEAGKRPPVSAPTPG